MKREILKEIWKSQNVAQRNKDSMKRDGKVQRIKESYQKYIYSEFPKGNEWKKGTTAIHKE